MILTDWFEGAVKPVRKGVYQREYIYGKAKVPYYCYWDGKQWSSSGDFKSVAPNQSLRWRGVLK